MKPHPEPKFPGYYWAKLIHPTGEPEGEDWRSSNWEVVQVNENYGEGTEELSVAVPGIGVTQWREDFVWGPRIPDLENSEGGA
jgi:hypothetical protein